MMNLFMLLSVVALLTFTSVWLVVNRLLSAQATQLKKEHYKARVGIANQFQQKERNNARCWWCILGRAMGPKNLKETKKIQNYLLQAGFRSEEHLGAYYFIKTAMVVLLTILMLGLWSWQGLRLEIVILVPILAILIPERVIIYLGKRRLQKVSEHLPDFLDMSNICMNAGLSYLVAIRRVIDELQDYHPDICHEFDYLLEQIRLGVPRIEALKQFAERNPTKEIQNLVQVLIQNEKLGSSIGEAINDFARRMYESREQKLEEKAAKTSAKMAIIILPFLMLPYLILLLGERMVLLGRGF